MPKITIYFIRSGMIFFALSLALAVVIELPASGWMEFSTAGLRPVFWHFLLVGWITQIIMGVSVWMFPRKRRGQAGGGEKQAWSAFGCLNTGLILRALTEPFLLGSGGISAAALHLKIGVTLSAFLQVVGGVAYVVGIWPRVKGKRRRRSNTKILPDTGMLAGRMLELAAVGLFISLHWNRIVAYQRGH